MENYLKKEEKRKNCLKNLDRSLKDASYYLSWDLDNSFAKVLLPILKTYLKKAEKIIDLTWLGLNKYEKRYYNYCIINKKDNWLFRLIKKHGDYNFKRKLLLVIDTLEDILMFETSAWENKWKIKPLLKVKYKTIQDGPDKGNATLYRMEVEEKYLENDKINHKNMPYNLKQYHKCYKWRRKNLIWFIKNLDKMWW